MTERPASAILGKTMEYKESNPFYHTAAWKRARKAALQRDRGMCVDCMARFAQGTGIRPRRAEVVHHIRPLEERPDLALRLDNLVSLCAECHNARHPEKGGSRRREEEKPRHRMRIERV